MAVTSGANPIILTAVGDSYVPTAGLSIQLLRVVNASNAGDVTLLDKAGGQELFTQKSLGANTSIEAGSGPWVVDGIYVSALPSGAKVYAYLN